MAKVKLKTSSETKNINWGAIVNVPGKGLKDKDLKNGNVLTTSWEAKANYFWDTGIAIGKFLSGLKEGKLYGTKCLGCKRTVIPPRIFCEWCFREVDKWVELKDTGTLNTFSVSFVAWDASRLKIPQVPALIDIDGANNAGILHLLSEVGETLEEVLKNVKFGMKVKAVWKKKEEREGAITDILYFKPI